MWGDLAQSATVRTVVEAHGRTWMIVYWIGFVDRKDRYSDELALAVPSDEGSTTLPAKVSLIQYTSAETRDRRARGEACAAAGHPIQDRWSMWLGKMERHCDCHEKKESRDPTHEELLAARAKRR